MTGLSLSQHVWQGRGGEGAEKEASPGADGGGGTTEKVSRHLSSLRQPGCPLAEVTLTPGGHWTLTGFRLRPERTKRLSTGLPSKKKKTSERCLLRLFFQNLLPEMDPRIL